MKRMINKRSNRKFISRLKKIHRKTIKNGLDKHVKKNALQVVRKRYIKDFTPFNDVVESREVIYAPKEIDYYKEYNHNKTNDFLMKVRNSLLLSKKKVCINFSDTEKITASAMISFLAEVDMLTSKCDGMINPITFTHPKIEKIESILKQIGFYDLLKKPTRPTKDFDDVAYWNYASGAKSDPQRAADSIKEIEAKISHKAQRKLYKGFSEAMANCVEHAYHEEDGCNLDETKWWAFAGVKENILVVVICDKGIGIPKSLPLNRADELIESIKSALKLRKLNDSAMINIASRMGRTRTSQGNRGKGLKDIKSIIDTMNEGNLSIYSNKGYYRYFRRDSKIKDFMKEHKTSVCGTIVEWAIPVTVSPQEV